MDALNGAHSVVVKIGSALLAERGTGRLRTDWLASLASDIAALRAAGTWVTVVSSGSIALGRGALGLGAEALTLERSQAAAAVGSIHLARAWTEALAPHGLTAAQVLLTLDDIRERRRYLNVRATLTQLLTLGAVPIVNENDTIATDEIRYGDNDRLAAQVAVTIGADLCMLLSDVDGLYTANPAEDPDARHIPRVERIDAAVEAMAGDAGSGLSKGGMRTKVLAARAATEGGCALVIASGIPDNPISRLPGEGRATLFVPQGDPRAARKRWIAAMKPEGTITVDTGAASALHDGRSLLPAGVTEVSGRFGQGDPVRIVGPDGAHIAAGLSRYTADEARSIVGLRSGDIERALGYPGRAALVHRDDMVEAR